MYVFAPKPHSLRLAQLFLEPQPHGGHHSLSAHAAVSHLKASETHCWSAPTAGHMRSQWPDQQPFRKRAFDLTCVMVLCVPYAYACISHIHCACLVGIEKLLKFLSIWIEQLMVSELVCPSLCERISKS